MKARRQQQQQHDDGNKAASVMVGDLILKIHKQRIGIYKINTDLLGNLVELRDGQLLFQLF